MTKLFLFACSLAACGGNGYHALDAGSTLDLTANACHSVSTFYALDAAEPQSDGGTYANCEDACQQLQPGWGNATCAEDGGLFNGYCSFGNDGVTCTISTR